MVSSVNVTKSIENCGFGRTTPEICPIEAKKCFVTQGKTNINRTLDLVYSYKQNFWSRILKAISISYGLQKNVSRKMFIQHATYLKNDIYYGSFTEKFATFSQQLFFIATVNDNTRHVHRTGQGEKVRLHFFENQKKRKNPILGKNILIVCIYGLNVSFEMQF